MHSRHVSARSSTYLAGGGRELFKGKGALEHVVGERLVLQDDAAASDVEEDGVGAIRGALLAEPTEYVGQRGAQPPA